MVSLNVTLKRRNLDDREVEYYRNKAKDEEFIYMACKFWETTGYLDSSGLSTLYRAIKVTGHIEDFLIEELEPGPAGDPAGDSETSSSTGKAETYPLLPHVRPLPPSEQTSITPLNNEADLPVVANQSHVAANDLWSDNLDLGKMGLEGLDFQPWLSWDDLNTSIFPGLQPTDGPRVSPNSHAGIAEQIVDPVLPTRQITDLASAPGNNEPVTASAHLVSWEPASSGLQPSDQGGLSYPTPSTSCNSPASGLCEITSASPAKTPRKRANKTERATDCKRSCKQKELLLPATISERTVYTLLKSCEFGKRKRRRKEGVKLSDEHVREVLKAGARLLRSDPYGTLRSSVQTWAANESRNLHALDIPIRWRGIEEAAEYFTKLCSDVITDPVANRVAELRLFINYKDMCKQPEHFCPRPRKKSERDETYVLNCITEAIPAYFRDQQSPDSRRDSISNRIRYGGWWWRLSYVLGIGILLLGGEELFGILKNDMFTNAQIDALITYASRVRPGTVRLLHLSNPVMSELIRGKVSSDLINAIRSDGSPLFAGASLISANNDDGTSLARQCPDVPWTNVVPEDEFPSDDFLAILSDTEMSRS